MDDDQKLTVGELRHLLSELPDDHLLSFSGHLTFYRLNRWNDHEHVVEFNEPQGLLTEGFKKRNPSVKVAFVDTDQTDWHVEVR
jgi:hypothetical protein